MARHLREPHPQILGCGVIFMRRRMKIRVNARGKKSAKNWTRPRVNTAILIIMKLGASPQPEDQEWKRKDQFCAAKNSAAKSRARRRAPASPSRRAIRFVE